MLATKKPCPGLRNARPVAIDSPPATSRNRPNSAMARARSGLSSVTVDGARSGIDSQPSSIVSSRRGLVIGVDMIASSMRSSLGEFFRDRLARRLCLGALEWVLGTQDVEEGVLQPAPLALQPADRPALAEQRPAHLLAQVGLLI